MGDPHGSEAILYHALDFKAHVVFSMLDIWILNGQYLAELQKRNIKFIPYIPIDQEPVGPSVINNIKHAYKIITFSKFGQETLEKEGFASTLIVEGIDTNIFKPGNKVEARQELNLPQGAFIFGMIGANKENPPRKGYQEALDAFKLFSQNHPEARIFFHCQQIHPGAGFPIIEYAQYLEIANKVFYLDQYKASYGSDSNQVAKEISAFDVLLHPSMTEGFGLLSIEAQACQVPVIVQRCTAMSELVIENKTGWICESQKKWWRNGGGYIYFADVNSLHGKMEEAYKKLQNPNVKDIITKACRKNVLQNYSIDDIVKNKWIPFLGDLQEEILGKVE